MDLFTGNVYTVNTEKIQQVEDDPILIDVEA